MMVEMKFSRIVFGLLFLLQHIALPCMAQTSAYIPIPDDAKWLYRCTYWHIEPVYYPETIEELFQISGDTVINAQPYKLVYRQRLGVSNVELVGAMRQDIPQRKVYGYSFSSLEESLIYDFDLTANQTMPCAYWFDAPGPMSLDIGFGLTGSRQHLLDIA